MGALAYIGAGILGFMFVAAMVALGSIGYLAFKELKEEKR